jgi:uncharacterized protein YfiM (DUF2279 family)
MKALIAVSLAVALSSQAVAGGIQQREFDWNDPSGKQHTQMMALGSVFMCGWLHLFTQKNEKTGKRMITRKHAILSTVVTGMSLGLAKELMDSRSGGTGFSANDMYHNAIGSAAGVTPFVLTYRF